MGFEIGQRVIITGDIEFMTGIVGTIEDTVRLENLYFVLARNGMKAWISGDELAPADAPAPAHQEPAAQAAGDTVAAILPTLLSGITPDAKAKILAGYIDARTDSLESERDYLKALLTTSEAEYKALQQRLAAAESALASARATLEPHMQYVPLLTSMKLEGDIVVGHALRRDQVTKLCARGYLQRINGQLWITTATEILLALEATAHAAAETGAE